MGLFSKKKSQADASSSNESKLSSHLAWRVGSSASAPAPAPAEVPSEAPSLFSGLTVSSSATTSRRLSMDRKSVDNPRVMNNIRAQTASNALDNLAPSVSALPTVGGSQSPAKSSQPAVKSTVNATSSRPQMMSAAVDIKPGRPTGSVSQSGGRRRRGGGVKVGVDSKSNEEASAREEILPVAKVDRKESLEPAVVPKKSPLVEKEKQNVIESPAMDSSRAINPPAPATVVVSEELNAASRSSPIEPRELASSGGDVARTTTSTSENVAPAVVPNEIGASASVHVEDSVNPLPESTGDEGVITVDVEASQGPRESELSDDGNVVSSGEGSDHIETGPQSTPVVVTEAGDQRASQLDLKMEMEAHGAVTQDVLRRMLSAVESQFDKVASAVSKEDSLGNTLQQNRERIKQLREKEREACEVEDYVLAAQVNDEIEALKQSTTDTFEELRRRCTDEASELSGRMDIADNFESILRELRRKVVSRQLEIEESFADSLSSRQQALHELEVTHAKRKNEAEKAHEKSSNELTDLTSRIDSLTSRMKSDTEHLIPEQEKLQGEMERANDLVAELEEKLQAAVAARDSVQRQLRVVDDKIADAESVYQSKLGDLRKRRSLAEVAMEDSANEMESLQEEESRLSSLREEISAYEQEQGDAIHKLAKCSKDIDSFLSCTRDLESSVVSDKEHDEGVSALDGGILAVWEALSLKRKELHEAENAYKEHEDRIEAINSRIGAIDVELPRIEERKKSAASSRNFKVAAKAVNEQKELEGEKENLNSELAVLMEKSTPLQDVIVKVSQEADVGESQLDDVCNSSLSDRRSHGRKLCSVLGDCLTRVRELCSLVLCNDGREMEMFSLVDALRDRVDQFLAENADDQNVELPSPAKGAVECIDGESVDSSSDATGEVDTAEVTDGAEESDRSSSLGENDVNASDENVEMEKHVPLQQEEIQRIRNEIEELESKLQVLVAEENFEAAEHLNESISELTLQLENGV